MPEGAVYVGRPSLWGNVWAEGDPHPDNGSPMSRADCVEIFRARLPGTVQRFPLWLHGLRDAKMLACWCPLDEPCHADVLIELLS